MNKFLKILFNINLAIPKKFIFFKIGYEPYLCSWASGGQYSQLSLNYWLKGGTNVLSFIMH